MYIYLLDERIWIYFCVYAYLYKEDSLGRTSHNANKPDDNQSHRSVRCRKLISWLEWAAKDNVSRLSPLKRMFEKKKKMSWSHPDVVQVFPSRFWFRRERHTRSLSSLNSCLFFLISNYFRLIKFQMRLDFAGYDIHRHDIHHSRLINPQK